MNWLVQVALNQFLVFTLLTVRTSGLVLTAPLLGSVEVPARVRALLALSLALLVAPVQLARGTSYPTTLIDYLVVAGSELAVGAILGLGVALVFTGVHLAGQIVAQTSGMQLADVVSPGFDTSVPVFSQLLYLVTLATFALVGGHRQLLGALLDSFAAIPPGQAISAESITEALVTLLSQSFILGIRAAAPTMTALLLATLVLGLISRTLPQLNVMVLGFGINAMVTVALLSLSLGTVVWLFQADLEPALDVVAEALRQ